MRKQKCLIITSSAGGGLLQAAVAQRQELLAKDPEIETIERDVLKDWVWKPLGKFSIDNWNRAQQKGNVQAQKFFVSFHRIFDYLTWPSVFFYTLKTLFKEDVDRVIDTQTTSTSAIVRAIRIFNWKRSKHLILEKLVVDLPTRKATHFFRPIRSLSKRNKKTIKVRTIEPLLEENETSKDFWKKHCGLCESEIAYEEVNVRQAFKKLMGTPRPSKDMSLSFKIKNKEEESLLRKALALGALNSVFQENRVSVDIPKDARVVSILLGSQPAKAATLNYVLNFISLAKAAPLDSKPLVICVFCADHNGKKSSLFSRTFDLLKREAPLPPFLSVIPFSFQSCKVIAPLFHRSSITCSRSGGGTAMELMAVSTGEIWIHSEAKGNSPNFNELLKGIPVWESESAVYLYKKRGAKIVTPKTFIDRAKEVLSL